MLIKEGGSGGWEGNYTHTGTCVIGTLVYASSVQGWLHRQHHERDRQLLSGGVQVSQHQVGSASYANVVHACSKGGRPRSTPTR